MFEHHGWFIVALDPLAPALKTMHKHTLMIVLGLMLGLSPSLWAATTTIYRWVDANGQVHYADHPNHAKARQVSLSVDEPLTSLPAPAAPSTAPSATISKVPPQVNINSADATTLAQSLEGVGEQKANAIVAHRKKHGPFKSIDALDQVSGIGEKTLEKNRARIAVR